MGLRENRGNQSGLAAIYQPAGFLFPRTFLPCDNAIGLCFPAQIWHDTMVLGFFTDISARTIMKRHLGLCGTVLLVGWLVTPALPQDEKNFQLRKDV
jgi:hypothetical protein